MVKLDRLNRVLEVDRESGLAKVEGGIVIRDLSEALYELVSKTVVAEKIVRSAGGEREAVAYGLKGLGG